MPNSLDLDYSLLDFAARDARDEADRYEALAILSALDADFTFSDVTAEQAGLR